MMMKHFHVFGGHSLTVSLIVLHCPPSKLSVMADEPGMVLAVFSNQD